MNDDYRKSVLFIYEKEVSHSGPYYNKKENQETTKLI